MHRTHQSNIGLRGNNNGDEETIHVEKNAGTRAGACMKGGKIDVSGFLEEPVLTFTIDSRKPKVKIDEGDSATGPFYVFLGDLAEKGNGKLVVYKTNNPTSKPTKIPLEKASAASTQTNHMCFTGTG
jgi:hypothetical protein